MSKQAADDLVKSITPEQLDKTRSEVHEEVKSKKDPETSEKKEAKFKKVDKLDLAMDIQLIMIGKFKYVLALIWVTLGLSIFATATQLLGQFRQLDIQGKMIVVTETQNKMLEEQRSANDKAKEDAKEKTLAIAEVKEEVKKTKEQVQEAVEAAPKLEVDPQSGRTKVVVPVKKPKSNNKKSGDKKDYEEEDDPAPPPSPPLPTQIELRDDF